jgi:hypothetical protein
MDLHERLDHGWTLIGGQMVHLHCAEHGYDPPRPTDDVDTVIDVRATRVFSTFSPAPLSNWASALRASLPTEPNTGGSVTTRSSTSCCQTAWGNEQRLAPELPVARQFRLPGAPRRFNAPSAFP